MRVYASYDPFPAPKGAATHIAASLRALSADQDWTLVTVAPSPETEAQSPQLPRVTHVPIELAGANFIDRVLHFRRELLAWWGERRAKTLHIRSIFEGYPFARERSRFCDQLVYEVNGLPSIELKYHYPLVADDRTLLVKLEAQEQLCLEAADLIVTPSAVTAGHLQGRGIDAEKIRVIPNGVDPELFSAAPLSPWPEEGPLLLYAGTLSAWQGVLIAIEALALYRRDAPARLRIIGPGRKRQRERLEERAAELGVAPWVEVLPACSRQALVAEQHAADVILAPFLANDRNLVQGCCPLKLLEAMSCQRPIISSDMPVVSALARNGLEALLVRPGSPKAIKDGLLELAQDEGLRRRLAAAARLRVEQQFSWERAGTLLSQAYASLGSPSKP